ncbi:hypothetical protein B0G81_3191 [Paraburkholderia sp. BL6665CI2N2]|uniref:esterase-like activity of phytase family protein n=1 Tax=Paraburkholderia sp. BL6665CI2N2 TaxID=1938806 RepID=UPI001066F829|nr:esterase-like activity of phytase family protein [Paraburkholderia sp. BL6665CI2N2]TDY22876.1 hypothetical protein B0G81_3191 [Paraburkholderia sp. BL6665CI2N2]
MSRSRIFALTAIASSLFFATAAHAGIDLIAVGQLSGLASDLSKETAAPLENGVAGNLLGGLGSGIAYAGCHTFVAVPDRGPNAVSYNPAIDDTASYINRFQTLRLRLKPGASGASLPYTMTPTLLATTLLRTDDRLVYGTGAAAGVPNGAPALNRRNHTNYFTGRSDNFDPTRLSTNDRNARFDPESVRVSNDGDSVFISDEYGPYVYRFDRRSGRRIDTYKLPDAFAVATLSPIGNDEISENTSGRVANKGMEGLAISPDGKTLFGAMQSPLIQDGGTKGAYTRIVRIDVRTGKTTQFAYPLTNIGTAAKPKYPTISDVVAVNDHEMLMDERDGQGLGDNSTAVFKKVFHIDLNGAQDVSNASGEAGLAPYAVQKTLFVDLVAALTAHGYNANDIPAKLEGLAFGPDVVVGGVKKHTLFVANDNDFIGTVTDTNHPAGIANPNQFFAFAWDPSDLPGYVAQKLPGVDDDHHGDHRRDHGESDRMCGFDRDDDH